MTYVLDACSIIAFFRREEGAEVVESLLQDEENVCYVHAINLCEVYYDSIRFDSEKYAEKIVDDLLAAGVIVRDDFDGSFWKSVARLKEKHRASLADFCGIALTLKLDGIFLTTDHHELDQLADNQVCSIEFIR